MNLIDMLKAIQASDPDGGEREPTEAAYEAHRRESIERFGVTVWNRYSAGGWGETDDRPIDREVTLVHESPNCWCRGADR